MALTTGQSNYLVRQGFTQEDQWRDALGNSERLLCFADTGYCLDAPHWLPSGCTSSRPICNVAPRSLALWS